MKTSKSAGGIEAVTDRLIPTAEREFDKLEQHLGCDLSGFCDVPAGDFRERERERNTNGFHTGTLFSSKLLIAFLTTIHFDKWLLRVLG